MNAAGLLIEIRKNKSLYYLRSIARQAIPDLFYNRRLERQLSRISSFEAAEIRERVNYYNKLSSYSMPDGSFREIGDLRSVKASSAYIYDTLEYTRYFRRSLKGSFLFGDIVYTAPNPAIQKSRPISADNENAVLMNLDKKRHFFFLNDPIRFEDKKDILVGRASVTQPHRIEFMGKYFGSPSVDIGQVNKSGGNPAWIKPRMSIFEHLKYKFILSLEGNDVATNLKWIMSSGSVAVMPAPRYETWFMEGRLVPDFHYIRIKSDYSDLTEVLDYFSRHPEEVKQIVRNANQYVKQFLDQDKEDLISLLVLEKYFHYTSQLDRCSVN